MVPSPLILVTGSAGRIGQAVVQELSAQGRSVRGFDLVPTPGLKDFIVGDISNAAVVCQATKGAGAVIHLAATPDDDDFMTRLLPNNLVGVYNVLEAARLAGVRRLVLASSGQVVWWQRQSGPWPVHVDVAPTPRSWYAAAKLFLEGAGRAYAEGQGMSVIVVRLGWCPRTLEQIQELGPIEWAQDVYLSPGDAGRFFLCAVDAPLDTRFALVYATSRPVRRELYDLAPARELLGYQPLDCWPQGLEVITGSK